jgi:hypothetical protein
MNGTEAEACSRARDHPTYAERGHVAGAHPARHRRSRGEASWKPILPPGRRSKDKTLKFCDGHFHDLLNDVDKEKVMADVTEWIATRLARA